MMLLRARLSARRRCQVQRLIPHAKGRAYGYLAAIVQLATVLASLIAT
jgi:hypothetical protein